MANQKSNPVGWFEIYVNDMDRATAFYETVLNTKLEQLSDPTDQSLQMKSFPGNMDGYGTPGSLVKSSNTNGGGSNVILYFSCEDCAIEEGRVTAAGGKVCQSKMSLGEYGFCAIVTDTEGNTIGLHSMK